MLRMHIDIPRAQLLIEERDTMETVGKAHRPPACSEQQPFRAQPVPLVSLR